MTLTKTMMNWIMQFLETKLKNRVKHKYELCPY